MTTSIRAVPRRTVLAGASLAGVALGAASCGFGNSEDPTQNDPDATGSTGGNTPMTLRQGLRPVSHLDPVWGGGGSPQATIMTAQMWEGLIRRDPDDTQNYLPGAAESWTTSDDGLVWVFKIRDGAKWSNGDPFTAKDFVWSFQYYFNTVELEKQGNENDPVFKADAASAFGVIEGLAAFYNGDTDDFTTVGVKAPDDLTLEITLTAPDYRFLDSLVRLYPLHQASVEANVRQFWLPQNFVGNGPYVLAEYSQNSRAVLQLNENHWDAANYSITTRDMQVNASGSTGMMVSYNADELDLFRVDGDPAALIAGRPDLEAELLAGSLTQFKGVQLLPTKNAVLQENPKVRQALAMALDRDALAQVSPPDVPGPSWVPSGITGADELPAIPFDVDGAKKLLAESGFENGDGIPDLQILTYANMPVLEAVAAMWEENLGISTSVSVQEVGVYSDMLRGNLPDDFVGYAFNYQAPTPVNIMRYGGTPYFEDLCVPFDIKREIYEIKYGKDQDKYPGPEGVEKVNELLRDNWLPEYRSYHELVTKAQEAQADPEESARLATDAAKTFQESYYWIPLLWAGYTFMVKPHVKGLKLTSYADDIFSTKGVTVER